jgi:hypothetical protein
MGETRRRQIIQVPIKSGSSPSAQYKRFCCANECEDFCKCIEIVGSPKVPLISSACPHNTTWVVEHVWYTLLSVRLDLAVLKRMRSASGQLY